MEKDAETIVRELLERVGNPAFEAQLRGYVPHDRLITTEEIPAMLSFVVGHARGKFEVVIPRRTVVEYLGGTRASSLAFAFPEEVHRAVGPVLFGKNQWLLEYAPSAYTLEVFQASAVRHFRRAFAT